MKPYALLIQPTEVDKVHEPQKSNKPRQNADSQHGSILEYEIELSA